MEKLTLIIPAYNEENRIGKTLESYGYFFGELKKQKIIDYKIIVVINNTKDNTLGVVKNFQRNNSEVDYLDLERGGKGFAVIEGFKEALKSDSNFIGFVDADMATPPESFYELFKHINGVDGVIASRAHPKSVIDSTKKRRITSRGFNFIVRSFMHVPFKDTQCGAKLFTKKAVAEILSWENDARWAFDVNLLYNLHKRNYKIKEIPTIWKDVEGSKLNLTKVPMKMFGSIVRLRLVKSPFNFVVRGYDLLPDKIKFHNN